MIIDQKKLGDTIEIIAVAPTQETLDVLSKDIKGNISLDINKQVKDQFLKNILTAEGYSLLEKAKDNISGCLKKEQIVEKESESSIFLNF